jgi:hypothetical protein
MDLIRNDPRIAVTPSFQRKPVSVSYRPKRSTLQWYRVYRRNDRVPNPIRDRSVGQMPTICIEHARRRWPVSGELRIRPEHFAQQVFGDQRVRPAAAARRIVGSGQSLGERCTPNGGRVDFGFGRALVPQIEVGLKRSMTLVR